MKSVIGVIGLLAACPGHARDCRSAAGLRSGSEFIKSEGARWAKLIKEAGIQPG